MEILLGGLLLALSVLLYLFIAQRTKLKLTEEYALNEKNTHEALSKTVNDKYGKIVSVEQELSFTTAKLNELELTISEYQSAIKSCKAKLDSIKGETALYEEQLEDISYGLYKAHFDYSTSEQFKDAIEHERQIQKDLIHDGKAMDCPQDWTVNGSKVEGSKMIRRISKLMLRAFNGECDAAINKVSWSNIANMEARIDNSFGAINKLGETYPIGMATYYRDSKLRELRLEFEMEQRIYQEKQEQRKIREEAREEAKRAAEIARMETEAKDEQKRYQKALDTARKELEAAAESQKSLMADKIAELEKQLAEAQSKAERAKAQAQLTKAGHVYILSNIGSFGDNIYKIGLTRRLEPMDRVDELGDASVPFDFDVHALVYSNDAPALETALHQRFDSKKINLINPRREFFKVSIDEIEAAVKELGMTATLTKMAEAREYRESQSLRRNDGSQRADGVPQT